MTPDDHVAMPPEVVECEDDGAAIAKATRQLDGHAIEVWNLDRFVTRIEPERPA